MTILLAFCVGAGAGLLTSAQIRRALRAERNEARLQRDQAEAQRDQAYTNVLVFDPVQRAMRQHPAGTRLPQQGQR